VVGRKDRLRRRLIVLALLAAVIAVDQAAKWWAWRHIPGANINPGGDFLTGPTIGRWYANPVTVCGSLMVGGWASNLLDRLGMHYWTAPGSVRGAVDFISLAGRSWNLADFFIIGATPLFLLATAQLARRAAGRPPPAQAGPARRNSPRARVPAVGVAGAALIMTVALGAAHHGSLTKPSHASTKKPPTCAPDSRAAAKVSHRGPACRRGPVRTAVRR
jgi:lipoprotein signal peptidase